MPHKILMFTLTAASLFATACQPYGSCRTSADCAQGEVCVHEHAHDLDWDRCYAPCSSDGASTCAEGTRCGSHCPDSPLGTACQLDDGSTAQWCE